MKITVSCIPSGFPLSSLSFISILNIFNLQLYLSVTVQSACFVSLYMTFSTFCKMFSSKILNHTRGFSCDIFPVQTFVELQLGGSTLFLQERYECTRGFSFTYLIAYISFFFLLTNHEPMVSSWMSECFQHALKKKAKNISIHIQRGN